jgi:hypothetical protein
MMNKFQAMARIMAILCENGRMKPGTQEYRVARKLVSAKIDNQGPDATWELARKSKGQILDQIRTELMLEAVRKKFPYLDI